MFDVQKLLGQMLSGAIGGTHKSRRSSGFGIPGVSKAQLGVGAIGIAIAAWEHFKSQPASAPAPAAQLPSAPPPHTAPPPPPPRMAPPSLPASAVPAPPPIAAEVDDSAEQRAADAAHLIRSMIAAANADGLIDAEERAAILQRALEANLDAATQQFLMAQLRAPASLEQIVAATRPELRLETYAAALIAVNVDTDSERAYLDRLAASLQMREEDRQRVHAELGVAP